MTEPLVFSMAIKRKIILRINKIRRIMNSSSEDSAFQRLDISPGLESSCCSPSSLSNGIAYRLSPFSELTRSVIYDRDAGLYISKLSNSYIQDPIYVHVVNCFDDYAECALYMVGEGYLCSEYGEVNRLVFNRSAVGPWELFKLRQVQPHLSQDPTACAYTIADHADVDILGGCLFALNPTNFNPGSYMPGVELLPTISQALSSSSVSIYSPDFLLSVLGKKKDKIDAFRLSSADSRMPVFVSEFFAGCALHDPLLNQYDIRVLSDHGLVELLTSSRTSIEPSLLILSNNNIHHTLAANHLSWQFVYERIPHLMVVIWDYDNHHWLSNSMKAALFSDVYVPAHFENIANLSFLAGHPLEIVPCGVSQFTKDSISSLVNDISESQLLSRRRILGMHRYYEPFAVRNYVVNAFSETFPGFVGFSSSMYDPMDEAGNLDQWRNSALSLVSPVQGDIPIRFFDSLATGGMPMVPSYLRPWLDVLSIPREFYFEYDLVDASSPAGFVERCYSIYMQKGAPSAVERIKYSLNKHHITSSLSDLLAQAFSRIKRM